MSGAGRRRLHRPRSATYLHLPDAGPVASSRCSTPDAGPAPGGTNRRHSGGQALSCPHEAGTIEHMSSQPPSRPSHSSPKGLFQRLVEAIRIAISYFSSEGPPSSVPGPAPRGVNDDHHGHRTFLYAVVAVVVVLVVLGAIVYLWVNGYLSAEVKFGILIGAVILLMIIMFLFGDEIGEYLFKLLLRLLTLPFVLLFRAGRGIWRALNKRSSRQATGYGQSPQTGYGQATSYGQAQSATQTGPPGIAAPGTPGPRGTQGTPPPTGYGTQSPHGTQPTPTTYGQATGYGQSPQTGYGRPGATGYGTQPPYGQTG